MKKKIYISKNKLQLLQKIKEEENKLTTEEEGMKERILKKIRGDESKKNKTD